MNILMILTSHDQLGDTGHKTGFWLEEFAAPYYVFKDAGAQITLADGPYHKVLPPGRRRPPCRDTKRARGRPLHR